MIFNAVRENEDIVQVHMDEFSEMVTENVDHYPLEGGWGVTVALLHNATDERTEDGREGRLRNVFLRDTGLLVRVGHVELGSECRASDVIPNLILVREWSDIPDRIFIALAKVNDRSQASVFFVYTKERGGLVGLARDPPARLDISVNLLAQ